MAGVLDNPKVERIFGLHVWPGMTTGHFAGAAGVVLAAAGAFEITIQGKGGHGAMPHLTIDPIACVAKLIVELRPVTYPTQDFPPTVNDESCWPSHAKCRGGRYRRRRLRLLLVAYSPG
jgi:metal-dependent amidase/aminoacylase/carboxypeptidase family protein